MVEHGGRPKLSARDVSFWYGGKQALDNVTLSNSNAIDLQALGFSANAKPHHVAVEPDGRAWYVSLIGDGRVLKFDRANKLVGQVRMETPGLLALDHVNDRLYVGRSMTAVNPPPSLGLIRRSDFTLVDEVEVFVRRPHALAVSPDGRFVYTASLAENKVAVLDADAERVELFDVPGPVHSLVQFTIAPNGRTMAVGGELSNQLLEIDLTQSPRLRVLRTLDVGAKPWDIVYAADGRTLWATLLGENAVAEVDVTSFSVRRKLTGDLAQPDGLALRPDGEVLFVANRNTGGGAPGVSGHDMHGQEGTHAGHGWLAIIDLGQGRTTGTLMLGASPTGVGAAGLR